MSEDCICQCSCGRARHFVEWINMCYSYEEGKDIFQFCINVCQISQEDLERFCCMSDPGKISNNRYCIKKKKVNGKLKWCVVFYFENNKELIN